jgi:hypothetical protein
MLDLQSAVNFTGDMCDAAIQRFLENQANLPSWTPEIDKQVSLYVQGVADWMPGSLYWSYNSERYFGKLGNEIKKTGVVQLQP